jgi:hypothetical protein
VREKRKWKLKRLGKQFKNYESGECVGKSREDFLADDTKLTKAVEERETEFGTLERAVIVSFKDKRAVCLYRFEKGYILEFENLEGEISRFSLSREAMFCLATIHGCALTPEEYEFERKLFSNS